MRRIRIFSAFTLFLLVLGCASPSKLVLQGDFDAAIGKLTKKVNKTQPKQKNVDLLERAFHTANQSDFERINYLKLSGDPDVWPEIYNRYQTMNYRQNMIVVLPEAVKKSIHFKPLNFQQDMIAAKLKAQEYLYAKAGQLLATNDRADARKAIEVLEELGMLSPDYPGLNELLNNAVLQATNKVLVAFENRSGITLPAIVESELMRISARELDESLLKFDFSKRKDVAYDFKIVILLSELNVSPERADRRRYIEKREIVDGMQPVRDERGNVVLDSTGKVVEEPRFRIVEAMVNETLLEKNANLSGEVVFNDLKDMRVISRVPVAAISRFNHRFAIVNGDLRACSEEVTALMQAGPKPFPQDHEMVMQAARILNNEIISVISNHKNVIEGAQKR